MLQLVVTEEVRVTNCQAQVIGDCGIKYSNAILNDFELVESPIETKTSILFFFFFFSRLRIQHTGQCLINFL